PQRQLNSYHSRSARDLRAAMSTTELLLAASGSGGGSNRVSIDDALSLHAGEFGRWQLRHFVLVTAAWMLEAMHTMVMIFADREPAMWCPAGDGRCGDRCAGAAAGWEWEQGSGSSTVAEWGLVCGERYKVGLVQAIYFAGCMMGTSATALSFRHSLTVSSGGAFPHKKNEPMRFANSLF
uniref:Uncharacterized protein n=1 Tax=Aegilops tauschii subsp. strangulata TaxID=200361 RepID=A0A453D2Z1_AEGTS